MPRIPHSPYLQLVRASALYDLLATAAFALPWSQAWVLANLSELNQALGGSALPAFEPMHQLIAGLLGSVVVVWSWLRLRHAHWRLGRYDAAARGLFSVWMLGTALTTPGLPLLWLYLLPEAAWGVAQAWPMAQLPREHGHSA